MLYSIACIILCFRICVVQQIKIHLPAYGMKCYTVFEYHTVDSYLFVSNHNKYINVVPEEGKVHSSVHKPLII